MLVRGKHHQAMRQRYWRSRVAGVRPRTPLEHVLTYLVILSVLASTLFTTARAQGTNPGATDPLGGPSRYPMYRDDELFTMLPIDGSTTSFSTYTPNGDLSTLALSNQANTNYSQSQAATSGRILSPDQDQVALARPDGNGNIELSLIDRGVAVPNANYKLPNAFKGFSGFPYPLSIKASDLDRIRDANGHFHDEVVVTYPSGTPAQTLVAVLDYTNATPDNPQPTAVTTLLAGSMLCEDTCPANRYNLLDIAIGDFDGDGKGEIAVVHLTPTATIRILIFTYTNNGNGYRALRIPRLKEITPPAQTSGAAASLSMAAGDFDGNGRDELAVASVHYTQPGGTAPIAVRTMLRADSQLTLTQVGQEIEATTSDGPLGRVQLVAGLFKLDPGTGFGMGRRQLAYAYNSSSGTKVNLRVLDTNLLSIAGEATMHSITRASSASGAFSLTAGNFKGASGDLNSAVWSLAYAAHSSIDNSYTAGLINVSPGTRAMAEAGSTNLPGPPWKIDSTWHPLVVPYDADGDAVFLGEPLHIVVQNVIRTDYVLYEPPKMTYYDEKTRQVVNISRYTSFNVDLKNQQGLDFKSSGTDTTNWSVGASVTASAGTEGHTGGDFGIVKAGASACLQLTAKASYNYDNSTANSSSNYNTRELGIQGTTSADDYVQGRYQTLHVWRYRVYGLRNSNPEAPYVFYDLMLPGTWVPFASGGLNYDWYQPMHENGNILSYPRYLNSNGTNIPVDLGSFTLPDGTVKTEPMIAATQQAWGGTTGHQWLKWTTDVGSGTETEFKHTMSASLDLKTAFKAEGGVPLIGGASVNGSLEVTARGGASWTSATISDNHTNGSTEIRLNTAVGSLDQAGSSAQSYFFYPVFYTTKDGTVKVAYSVDPTGSNLGKLYWQSRFGGRPDPALNLPARFISPNGTDWEPNPMWSQRKMMRGFGLTSPNPDPSVANPNPDPIIGDYPKLVYTPVAGDRVRVAARVYNYSIDTPASNVRVRFQAVKFNASTLQETGPRVNIGDALVSLGSVSQGNQIGVAAINWDTTGFGPLVAGASQEYRIYVVVNPRDDNPNYIADEIYPAEPAPTDWQPGQNGDVQAEGSFDPGQNNEGYGLAYVASPRRTPGPLVPPTADVFMKRDSLAILEADGTFYTERAQGSFGKPILLRATVFSDHPSREYSHLLLYDGDPANGGRLIADKQVFVGDHSSDGSAVWVQWRPTNPTQSVYTLYARVLEDHSDSASGNNVATLEVHVTDLPRPAATIFLPMVGRGTTTLSELEARPVPAPQAAPQASPQAVTASDEADCSGGGSDSDSVALAQGAHLAHGAPGSATVPATQSADAPGSTGNTPWVSRSTLVPGLPLARSPFVLWGRPRRRRTMKRRHTHTNGR